MALDRWIALIFVTLCFIYGYAAFFTMDQLLPPFMQRNPIWPSSFPKVLSVLGIIAGSVVLLGLEKPDPNAADSAPEINEYKLGQALGLLALMAAYALMLRPLGFLLATVGFLAGGGVILGERKFHILIPVAALAAGVVWYLVQQVLGIFLSPLPSFL